MEAKHHPNSDLRKVFEDFEPTPSEAVWGNLEQQLHAEKPGKKVPWGWISVAAAVVLLLVIGGTVMNLPEAPGSLTEQENPALEQKVPSVIPPAPSEKNDFAAENNATEPMNETPVQPQIPAPAPQKVFASSGNGQTSTTTKDSSETAPQETPRPSLQVSPLSLETVYLSQAEIPTRQSFSSGQLPAPEKEDKVEGPDRDLEDPLFGKIVNAGNALFNLPAEYTTSETEGVREEAFYADLGLIKIKKHKTYRN